MEIPKKTILFAEDEDWVMEGIAEGLESYGYGVIGATDGSSAIRKFRTCSVDLVLLDIMMPPGDLISAEDAAFGRLTGVEVCRIIRKERPSLPVICLTAIMDRKIHKELQDLGATVIEKPALPSEIARRVKEMIGD